ncbi:MAG: DEAD/DEAH box helicase [Marinomonas foliarum]|jgi:ATP-dependent RNA helicase DeaD|uniref:ATP-dependent RNA helicase DeaD n=1 Tax=Marinomonas foliarum TaxID=491950 RepID=A0A368ZNX6_9GAMM|nr:DEAD/DEAH box helicase [Marinomonas foliarum]QRV24212.1 DEAD/DEAH box helicase [Marinomonas foliarum]RCW97052.1 ATP-dependent RNA helicase CsdA [Marinomonas foliarum]
MSDADTQPTFDSLGLIAPVLKAVADLGYEQPSAIQAQSIPYLLEGRDLLGQAQTGTGKTAAFALPLLSRIDVTDKTTQLLVLAPTRELAIQVSEAFQSYARNLPDFHVLPIYGGMSYDTQLRQLKRGVQVVVGTPGRVMDHIRRKTLKLDGLKALVLDEADEMLRMGFIDDVEWILEQTPSTRQIALFSATMPAVIRQVANRHLNNPKEVKIVTKTSTAMTITQKYWPVSGLHKLDALTRILEMNEHDGMIIFVRTKAATVELAEKLTARGHACEALNGDISQNLRERTVDRIKKGQIDILVATDVVARGLDVERVSHVVNYDIPYDTESYVHRIGRTGRAGRSGTAILFVAHRERRMLQAIERATRQPIESMTLPTASDINAHRVNRFKQRITDAMDNENLDFFLELVQSYQKENEVDPLKMAAALAHMAQGKTPLLLSEMEVRQERRERRDDRENNRGDRAPRERKVRPVTAEAMPLKDDPSTSMTRFVVQVGYNAGVKPGNIVGAIANEADIESRYIGHIEIYEDFSTVDLPTNLNADVLGKLSKTRICGQRTDIAKLENADELNKRAASPSTRKRPAGGSDRRPSNGGERRRPAGGRDRDNNRAERRPRTPRKDG